jgi:rhamnulokinase
MNRTFLALDLGAESGRAILAHLAQSKVTLTETHRFANTPVRLPGALHWDTLRLFHEICEGIRSAGRVNDDIEGIGVDTWGVDFGLLSADGRLLENPYHYRDARTQGVPEQAFRTVPRDEVFRETGIQFMEINSLYQLLAAQRDTPKLLEITGNLLFMPDLFNYFLCGVPASERTIASTSQFYNPVKRSFATDMLRRFGIQAGFLPPLVDPGTELGGLGSPAREGCTLKSDPVIYAVGSHDTASAVAAVPASERESWCYISSGTWSLMGVELEKPLISGASLEANFTNEVGLEGRIRFLKNIPGLWVLQECRRAWARNGMELSYTELMAEAETCDSGTAVLDLDLFTAPGNYPQMICDFCKHSGQQSPKTPGETAHLVLRSLAHRYAQTLETLERLTGKSYDVIHIVGGGSKNRLLNQLTADVTGRRVIAGPAEATATGNALTQAMGAGAIHSLEELRAVVRNSFEVEEFRPARTAVNA